MYTATIGFFDGVHLGHRCLIDQVRDEAGRRSMQSLVITFDRHPRQVVQTDYVPSLLTTGDEKLALLRATGIDEVKVLPFDKALSQLSAREFMQRMHDEMQVRVLIMGYDHRFGHDGGTHEDYVRWGQETGIEVVLAHELEGQKASSSEIRRLLQAGRVTEAADILGYRYILGGDVVKGYHIGHELGFPTANVQPDAQKMLPACGVYAVWCTLADGSRWAGMLNIGNRPTIDDDEAITIEVNLLDFSGDLYGQKLSLEFVDHVRSEHRFSSREALAAQLQSDAEAVRKLLG